MENTAQELSGHTHTVTWDYQIGAEITTQIVNIVSFWVLDVKLWYSYHAKRILHFQSQYFLFIFSKLAMHSILITPLLPALK